MIPITTFAGKKSRGLRPRQPGLLAARALKEGGADVVVFDDDGKKTAEAHAAGLKVQDLHNVEWAEISALLLTPGVPLTHPEPHWTVRACPQGECPSDWRHRIVLPGAGQVRTGLPADRDHRHEWQIDDDRTHRALAQKRRTRCPDRRQYRRAGACPRAVRARSRVCAGSVLLIKSIWRLHSSRR